ncbi:MAG TPA: hypothetical protein VKX17_09225 [Planctomycetota bacterium]|nr:hypothetical protein [Planctomycetota bacterium]
MPEPPRRARFQIHLSTAIVLMFVAGGLIWANVYGRRLDGRGMAWTGLSMDRVSEQEFLACEKKYICWAGPRTYEYGWPLGAMQTGTEVLIDSRGGTIEFCYDKPVDFPKSIPIMRRTGPIIYNALIALAILFAVWLLCEWLIRRRAARNGA